jgi:hypothetical protein
MTRVKIKYIALAFFGVLVVVIMLIRAQQTKSVNISDTTLVGGAYLDIEKMVVQNHDRANLGADTSYNLYLSESNQSYKISDIQAGCFMYGLFKQEVREGDYIKIYVGDKMDYFSIRPRLVYCVIANNKEYLSFDCQKRVIDNNKIYEPIAFVVIFALIAGLIYLKRDMKTDAK